MSELRSSELRSCNKCHLQNLNSSYFYKSIPTICKPCIRKTEIARYYKVKEECNRLKQNNLLTTCKDCGKEKYANEFYCHRLLLKRCKECDKEATAVRLWKKEMRQRCGVIDSRRVVAYCMCCQNFKTRDNFTKLVIAETYRNEKGRLMVKNRAYQGLVGGVIRKLCIGCLELMVMPLMKEE